MSHFPPGYYITAELRVKEESQTKEAIDALTVLCAETLKEPGCSIFQLHQDATTPQRFILWERFDDETAFKRHFEESHTKAYVALNLTEVVQYFQTSVMAA
jgi:quinol monooxygenase YgiN